MLFIGCTSNRFKESGAWYINALVDVFDSYHENEDLLSMMTRVNSKVNDIEYRSVENNPEQLCLKQCPAPVLTLTRNIRFH